MNALATDQARRFARFIAKHPGLPRATRGSVCGR
jgi:ATP-dependent helicase YprA (DUF1998 family)